MKKTAAWWSDQPIWTICDRQNGFIFPNFRGKNKIMELPPPKLRPFETFFHLQGTSHLPRFPNVAKAPAVHRGFPRGTVEPPRWKNVRFHRIQTGIISPNALIFQTCSGSKIPKSEWNQIYSAQHGNLQPRHHLRNLQHKSNIEPLIHVSNNPNKKTVPRNRITNLGNGSPSSLDVMFFSKPKNSTQNHQPPTDA